MQSETAVVSLDDLRGPRCEEVLCAVDYDDIEEVLEDVAKELISVWLDTKNIDEQLWNLFHKVTCHAREVWRSRREDLDDVSFETEYGDDWGEDEYRRAGDMVTLLELLAEKIEYAQEMPERLTIIENLRHHMDHSAVDIAVETLCGIN